MGESIAEGISTFQVTSRIDCTLVYANNLLQFEAIKPNYVTGASQSLKTRKVQTKNSKPAVWSIDDDDALEDIPIIEKEQTTAWSLDADDDLVDENQLLEDVDKEVVSVLPDNDDCENVAGRKGACKNCTCGRAEMDEKELTETKSSCGNVS